MTYPPADAMNPQADTFFAATAVPHAPRPRLKLEIDTNVCVVGAGYAGLWIARELVRRGHDVVVLEAGRVGAGASGRNGGFCAAGFGQDVEALVDRVGLDHARALYRLSREGVDRVRALLADGPPGLDAVPGRIEVQRHDDEDGLKRQAELLGEKFGHDVLVWPTERVRETLKTERYFQALHDADAINLHPLNLLLALATEIEQRGGRIYEDSRVVAADLDGVRKWVATSDARVRAHQIVLCGSHGIGPAFPELSRCILPVATHLAVTTPLGDKLHEAIRYQGGIADTRRAFDYYRVAGDRLVWGGYLAMRLQRPRGLERKFARDIEAVYPSLAGASVEYAWTGAMGWSVHRMPQIGLLRPGVWAATAFGGQGINATAVAGDLIAAAIAENDDRWRLFIPFGLVRAGGALGRMAVQAYYYGAVARDWLDEKLAKRARERREDEAARAAENARLEKLAARERAAKPSVAKPRSARPAKTR
jgi:gamma-glutamylputrescine oxidase